MPPQPRGFVADTEIFEFPGLFAAVFLAKFCHRAVIGCHIFYPFGKFLDRTASDITADIRLHAGEFTEIKELMGAE